MHELSITQTLLEQALFQAERAGAGEIVGIHLTIGDFSSFSPDSIRFYWEQISKGTLAEGANLTFQNEKGVLHCPECDLTIPSKVLRAFCPRCGGSSLEVMSGQDAFLTEIDIND
jgi:hydrogenase nickel incorporation protein HypA/HybF